MASQTLSYAGMQTVVNEQSIIDRIAEAHRHLGPPDGAFSIDDYVNRVKARGGSVSYQTALRTLTAEVEAGRLNGNKFVGGDRERWYFWGDITE